MQNVSFHQRLRRTTLKTNHLKEIRESLLISKSELSRKAGVSLLTICRIEKGLPSRNETKRKILAALGMRPSQKDTVFSRS
jgi:predicted transcriptional regulator